MKQDGKYSKFELVKEMLETGPVVAGFDADAGKKFLDGVSLKKKIFLTGEGSSRIFPAKRAITNLQKISTDYAVSTQGATQALDMELGDTTVFGASNSGKTKEVVRLFTKLKKSGSGGIFGLTATDKTPVVNLSEKSFILACGKENTVAATKSVAEQALFYQSLFDALTGKASPSKKGIGDKITKTLTLDIDPGIIEKIVGAPVIYFAGRNDGVAEELTLKTNEITRKKSAYLEGTYAVHGIEEVMAKEEVVIVIDPFESEEEKFNEVLKQGVGMEVIAVASRKTSFPTIVIPEMAGYNEYLQLCAGWNILVEVGLKLGIDLDKPERARKIGNELNG